MQHVPTSFRAVIASWPTVVALANDLGVPYQTAAAMKRRGSIDPGHWPKLLERAPARGIEGLTWEALAKMAAGVGSTPAHPAPPRKAAHQ